MAFAAAAALVACGDGGPVVFPDADQAAPPADGAASGSTDAPPNDTTDDTSGDVDGDTADSVAGSGSVPGGSVVGGSVVEPATTATTVPPSTSSTLPAPPPPSAGLEGLSLGIELVEELELPTAAAWGADGAMYVTTQDGIVHRVGDRTTVAADLSEVVTPFEYGSERGLLGIAFDPRDDRMFLNYTDRDNDTHVVSFRVEDGAVVRRSRREHLFIEQPGIGHNGGHLVFDDDGHLFISSGDGGGSNGLDAQDTDKLFGAILRIIPTQDGYDIPPDNPFAEGAADQPEVWVRGLRNPWGFSLDEATGDVWIGDVGNSKREEIDLVPSGESGLNFGWRYFEGTEQIHTDAPPGLTPPVHDYPRSEGVAVIGGHVYRGAVIPELQGAYVFGDFTGPLWAMGEDGVSTLSVAPVSPLVGIEEGPDGELYLLGHNTGVYALVPG